MSFSIGIVGLPNVGKSTLFNALTKKQVDIANYPFCTIEPNKGIVKVPDARVDALTKFSNSKKTIFTTIEFIDIAGLVKGASTGEGLGNKFLSHIREVDAICQVVRNFEDKNIIHVDNKIDPDSDIEVINLELILADMQTVDNSLKKARGNLKGLKASDAKRAGEEIELFEKVQKQLENGNLVNKMELEAEEREVLRNLNLLTIKPFFYVVNVSEKEVSDPVNIPKLAGEVVIPICARLESELSSLSDAEVAEYLKEAGIKMTGLDRVISEAYKILNLITYLTTGEDETRAWTITRGMLAPQAAGVIHTDFERGFIAVEVINWQDLINAGSESAAREKGLIRLEGKGYEVKDGDICVFRFSV